MSDQITAQLKAIKERYQYASAGEPGAGEDDIYWLIGTVDALLARNAGMERHLKLITGQAERSVNYCSTGECGG